LNGVEGVAVADKVATPGRWTLGRTYRNIPVFMVPGSLRPPGLRPYYVDWETRYVGLDSRGLTVVPMPAVVEAYLAGGILGIVVVFGALGGIFAWIDRFGVRAGGSALGAGIYGYAIWRLLNIEQNLFVILVPLTKVIVVACGAAWIYGRMRRPLVPAVARRVEVGRSVSV
jgi:hypothetical protein